jgi:6-phosphogluconolactonase
LAVELRRWVVAEEVNLEEPQLRVQPDAAALAQFAATTLAAEIKGAVSTRGEAVVALPGGSTPEATLELLAIDSSIEWSKVVLLPADERLVPVSDPESNEGMIRRALLAKIHGPTPILVSWGVEEGLGPETVRGRFEGQLLGLVPRVEGEMVIDIVLLGMGSDGHTASLFPGPAYSEHELVLATKNPTGQQRLSLGPLVLRSARRVRFLISGIGKASALAEVARGRYEPERWPAQLVARRSPTCEIWCDAEAASLVAPSR